MSIVKIIYKDNITEIESIPGENVYELINRAGIYLDAPCGGRGRCGKCKVKINGNVSAINENEKKFLKIDELNDSIRLACYTEILGDITVFVEHSLFEVDKTKISDKGIILNISDTAKNYINKNGKGYGFAVDIGTTTIAAFFYDLNSGQRVYTTSSVNPQRAYGADVMSRINYCIKNKDGLNDLHKLIINKLNDMIKELSHKTNINPSDIIECVIVGNTTMELIASNMSVDSLGFAPYTPSSYLGEYINSKDIGLDINENGEILFMPVIGGFLGGDAVAVMLAEDFINEKNTAYMVDIGTNGEMAIVNTGEIIACSTAAGPALEGAQIQFGMGSVAGAIKRVEINENKMKINTVNNALPIGICGSGIIDSVSAMLITGSMDETGRIENVNDFTNENSEGYIFNLTENIFITQKDIREVQLAKSAIAAGTNTLLKEANLKAENIEKIYVAGGFGSNIDLMSAKKIGLLPESFCDRASVVGNAAGLGAIMALLSTDIRQTAKELVQKVKVIELTGNPIFEDEFIDNMMFNN